MIDRYEKRVGWIDTARGIGYILVVAGHILGNYSYEGVVISSFHVPLFFFLSGCVDKPEKYDFRGYVKKLSARLLVPFFGFASLTLIYKALTAPQIFGEFKLEWVKEDLYRMTFEHVDGVYLWFFIGLFWTKIMFWIIIRYVKEIRLVFALTTLMGVLAVAIDRSESITGLPLRLDSAMFLILFYAMGYFGHTIALEKNWQKLMVFVTSCVIVAGSSYNEAVSAAFLVFGRSYILFIINALAGIILITCVSRFLERKIRHTGIFKAVNSLTVEMLGTQIIAIELAGRIQQNVPGSFATNKRVMNFTIILIALLINYCIAKLIHELIRLTRESKLQAQT